MSIILKFMHKYRSYIPDKLNLRSFYGPEKPGQTDARTSHIART